MNAQIVPGIRNFGLNAYISAMNKTPSPEQVAKLERKRLSAEDGAKALEEALDAAIAIRVNMARLRELRLAKEAQEVRTEISTGNKAAKPKPKKRFR